MADKYMTIGSDGTRKLLHDNADADSTYSDAVHLQSAAAAVNLDLDVEAADLGVYVEDAAHSTGANGSFVLTVRSDTAATTAGTDGDYAGLTTDASGALWTRDNLIVLTEAAASPTVDEDGTARGPIALFKGIKNLLIDLAGGFKAEDTAHTSGDLGIMPLTVRQDNQASLGADGDYVPLSSDSSGSLRVSVVSEQATFYTEDSPIDENTVGQTLMLKRQDTLSAVEVDTDEDAVALRGSAKGEAYVKAVDSDALLTTIDADTSNIATYTTDLPNVIGTDGSAGPSKALSVAGTQASGELQELLTDADGHLQVDVLSAASTAVTNAGTFAVQVDGAALTALQLIDDAVYTDGSGTPSKGLAVMGSDGTNPQLLTCTTAGDLKTVAAGATLTLKASAAETESTNGTAVACGQYKRFAILFDLTVADTDAGDTLDVYIDMSPDGGTTWLNAVHFNQIIGTDSAVKHWAVLDSSNPGTATILVTSDAAEEAVRPSLFGSHIRYRSAITDAGTDDASFTYAVTAYAQ
jgi:hypothetical protein